MLIHANVAACSGLVRYAGNMRNARASHLRLLAPILVCAAALLSASVPSKAQSPHADATPMPAPSLAPPTLKNVEFLEQYAATRGFTHGTPKNISITSDGSAVLFLRSGPRSFVQDLYQVDTATGQEKVLLTAEQLL